MKKTILTLIACMSTVAYSYAGAGTGSVATSTSGATFVSLPAGGQGNVHIVNDTGTALEARIDGKAVNIPIANLTGFSFEAVGRPTHISVRRADQSNTPVTVKFIWDDKQ